MKKISKQNKSCKIVCNLYVGERIKQIKGIGFFKSAYEYVVKEEYPYHYIIGVRYEKNMVPDLRNFIYISVLKASIYCGDIVIIKENGERVTSLQKEI